MFFVRSSLGQYLTSVRASLAFPRMQHLAWSSCGLLLVLAACAADGPAHEKARSVVVLSADQATEIVVPAGFGAATTTVPVASTIAAVTPTTVIATPASEETDSASDAAPPTEAARTDATDSDGDRSVGDESTETAAETPAPTTTAEAQATSTTAVAPTTTTTTTTTVTPTKETVPLAEENINPGVKLMGALDDFNSCLATEGYEWMGFPNPDLGANDPVNQPAYLQALQFCNSRTGISQAFQEFQTSRSDLTPEEIRQENENFILLADCLRSKGWLIGELSPDENGLLNPGDQFSSADGDVDTGEIRDCVSETSLAGEQENGS